MTDDEIVLRYMLWGFDETPYRVLGNQMTVTRKPAQCAICLSLIPTGSRVRAQREAYDGKAMTFRLCPECCRAVVLDHLDGDCLRMEDRTQMGMRATLELPLAVDAVDPSADSTGKLSTRA